MERIGIRPRFQEKWLAAGNTPKLVLDVDRWFDEQNCHFPDLGSPSGAETKIKAICPRLSISTCSTIYHICNCSMSVVSGYNRGAEVMFSGVTFVPTRDTSDMRSAVPDFRWSGTIAQQSPDFDQASTLLILAFSHTHRIVHHYDGIALTSRTRI
ncbi:hypothetical protein BOTCAL_0430g00070 [Botryotinia calthae]|uniref:Uncharacterized protein n=1 Tax=Botryotinia calthae TaxID=38488 RepID=A0A4Y8CNY3_9HELO|nr:hypothetical protein BOTCAL_0430g00070 [Botryotinia calthae]